MCSWGHDAKNSTAFFPWVAGTHTTITLVFIAKARHGRKRSLSGHGHKCQGGVQNDTIAGRSNSKQLRRCRPIWTVVHGLNTRRSKCHVVTAKRVLWYHGFCLYPSSIHACSMESSPPCRHGLPFLSRVTALPLWHKSSIWFHLTGDMNNWSDALLFPASSTSLAITSSLASAISLAG